MTHGLTNSPPDVLASLIERIREAKKLVLLLDYDGTLVEFNASPHLAIPDADLLNLLTMLAHRPGTFVHLVSGRQKEALEKWFQNIPLGLHAEHGFWSRLKGDASWSPCQPDVGNWKSKIYPMLEQYTVDTPGTLIEEKTAGLAWHYRMADPNLGQIKANALRDHLMKALSTLPVEVFTGEKVIEVRLKGVHKGKVVQSLLEQYQNEGHLLLVGIGDDQTDEDMFAALPADDVAIHVGSRKSRAAYRLPDPASVRLLLKQILSSESGFG